MSQCTLLLFVDSLYFHKTVLIQARGQKVLSKPAEAEENKKKTTCVVTCFNEPDRSTMETLEKPMCGAAAAQSFEKGLFF